MLRQVAEYFEWQPVAETKKIIKKATKILILKSTDNHTCAHTNLKSHKLMQNLPTITHTLMHNLKTIIHADARSKDNHSC